MDNDFEAEYHAYQCAICDHSVDGVSPEDAIREHDAWGFDHKMKVVGE